MAKRTAPQVTDVSKYLKKDNFLPVYFLCGEDQYTLDIAADHISKAVTPFVLSEFDKEVINAEKSQSLSQVLDLAFSFPFGGGVKFLIIKNFDRFNDKKELLNYLKSPAEFSVLLIIQPGKVADFSKEPYASLLDKKMLFEAAVVSGDELASWAVKKAKMLGVNFSEDNARTLIEIVGDDKALIEMQLKKIFEYGGGNREITFEEIKKLASPTKEYSIFDLQDSIGKGDKSSAVKIGENLLDSGVEIVFIINMLSKFILTVAQIIDLVRSRVPDNEAAKMAGVSWGYYFNCKKASYLLNDERLLTASRALLRADLATKTSSASAATVLLVLIAEMLGEEIPSNIAI